MQRLMDKMGINNDINRLIFCSNSSLSNTIHIIALNIGNTIFIT